MWQAEVQVLLGFTYSHQSGKIFLDTELKDATREHPEPIVKIPALLPLT